MSHQSDLITEYVHPSKLNSFVTRELEENDELPSWLLGSVQVEETNRLSIQKSKKNDDDTSTEVEAAEEGRVEEDLIEEDTEHPVFVASCDNCQLRKSGACSQIRNELCTAYRCIPFISQEEKEYWPPYGDATAISRGETRR